MRAVAAFWCSIAHDSPKWPIHGHYACGVCGREYPVEWSKVKTGERPKREPRVYRQALVNGR